MKQFILSFLSSFVLALAAYPQSADDPNEGTRLIPQGNGVSEFRWWARDGVYYLVDVSDDLVTWNYLNEVFVGDGGVSAPVYLNTSADRLFARLNADPFNTDKDGDGIPDGWEVLHGLNPRNPNDASRIAPGGVTYLQKYVLGLDPDVADTDGDGVSDGTEITNNTNPKSALSHPLVWRTEWREIGYAFLEYVGDADSSEGSVHIYGPNYYDQSTDLTSRKLFTSLADSLAAGYPFADTPDNSGNFDVALVDVTIGLYADANSHVTTEVHHWATDVTENTDWAGQDHRRIFLEIHPAPTEPITKTMLKVTERVIDGGASMYQVEPVIFTIPAEDTKSAPVDLIPAFSTSPPSGNHSEYVGVSLLPVEFKRIYEENNPVNFVHNTTPRDDPPALPRNILYTVVIPGSLDYHLKLDVELAAAFRTKFMWAVAFQGQIAAQGFFPASDSADVVFSHNAPDWRADYDVIVGFDANGNSQLDAAERIVVNVPKLNQPLKIHGINSSGYAESNIAIATGTVLGGLALPLSEALLDIFFFGDASQVDPNWAPTSTVTVPFNCLRGEWSDWLTHNAGAAFDVNGQANIKLYTWNSTTAASKKLARAPSMTEYVRALYGLKEAEIQAALEGTAEGYERSFPSETGWFDIPVTRIAFEETALHLDEYFAVARARINGWKVRFKVKKTAGGFQVVQTTSTGAIEDLYDFNYIAGFLSKHAATVQLSHGNGSFGEGRKAGQIYRNRFDFSETWNELP